MKLHDTVNTEVELPSGVSFKKIVVKYRIILVSHRLPILAIDKNCAWIQKK